MKAQTILLLFGLLAASIPPQAAAEVIVFENGDQLRGAIVSLDAKEIKLQNPNLGLVTIPRERVSSIILKDIAIPGISQPAAHVKGAGPTTNDPIAQIQSGIDPKLMEQIQKQFLGTATPESQAMFDEMLSGLASGRINLNDIREQARGTLQELKKLESDLDEDEKDLFGMYSGILERFIAQGTNTSSQISTNNPRTNRPALKTSPPGKLEFQKVPRNTDIQDE